MKKIAFHILFLLFSISAFPQNYDESKVGSYVLPELLITENGEKVTTVKDWEEIRRPEILKLFEDNIYGQVPQDFDGIKFKKVKEDKNALGGKATLKEIDILVTRNLKIATIHLLLFIPNKVKYPVPVFLAINHRGMKTMDTSRENKDDYWPVEEVIDAGYAIAGFDVKDVAPDDKDHFADEIIKKLYPEQQFLSNGMRALGAWGWGASRAIDYFETDKAIDAQKVIVIGHSRSGKAALWCGVQDKRVVITISNESGNSGAKISRRNYGESVDVITKAFPHWFIPDYRKFSNNEGKLPIDQHMLLALIAPRAVYVGSADDDKWADPKGQYIALFEAQPAFSLYGFDVNLTSQMPRLEEQVISLPLGFHNRKGEHDLTLSDWQQYIHFANAYFKKK